MGAGAKPVEEATRMDSQRTDGQVVPHVMQATQKPRDLSPQALSIMTTEYYNLQTGRAMTISDANGRAGLFLGSVSTSLVALAFVGGVTRSATGLGQAFYVFGLVLFPTLVFLGLVTFMRVMQSGIEDLIYGRGINRIRHLYQEHVPEMRPYFVLSAHDDEAGVFGNLAMRGGVWQLFLSSAGMIAVINSVIVGAFAGLLVSVLFATLPLGVPVGVGVIAFLGSVALHQRYQWRQGTRSLRMLSAHFPASSDNEQPTSDPHS
jgi:hypothetical protein